MTRSGWAVALLLVCSALSHAMAQEPAVKPGLPTFPELEAEGAVIGEVRINTQNIFDLDHPRENNALFRLANRLHVRTRPRTISRELLFKPGDRVSVRLIEETERVLRSSDYLYDVVIQPIAYRDGVVDVEVRTRDTWTFEPGIGFSRGGGKNSAHISLEEDNLLGTGVAIGVARVSNVDRGGTEFNVSSRHALGVWTGISYSYASFDDGRRQSLSVARPFYALDTRSAAGLSVSEAERIDPVYEAGNKVAEYRTRQQGGELFGGWSQGLVEGWTRRYSVGISHQSNAYSAVAGQPAPPQLPVDLILTGPFVRYELIEDAFQKLTNRDQIERAEFFNMGFQTQLQLGRALSTLGSTRDLWTYSGSLSNGFEPWGDHILLASAAISGRYAGRRTEQQLLSGSARYYIPQGKRALLFASAAGAVASHADISGALDLGGDNGLRGYPLRYQRGDRRALLTLEQRVYSDWYPWRLFRVGGAVFYDVGRAWSGPNQAGPTGNWLADAGFGVRLLSARSAFGNVLHADIAFPLNRAEGIKAVQFTVKSRVSF
jgi:outer membrane protein assembly factor BamA